MYRQKCFDVHNTCFVKDKSLLELKRTLYYYNTFKTHIIFALGMEALLYRKLSSSHNTCHNQKRDKRDTLYSHIAPYLL